MILYYSRCSYSVIQRDKSHRVTLQQLQLATAWISSGRDMQTRLYLAFSAAFSTSRFARLAEVCIGLALKWVGKLWCGVEMTKTLACFVRFQGKTPGNTLGTTPDMTLPLPCRVFPLPCRRSCGQGLSRVTRPT